MNKLRQSFRRKKDIYVPESSRPHQWQTDEEAVRSGKCSFGVKVTLTHKHTHANTREHNRPRKLRWRSDAWVQSCYCRDGKDSFRAKVSKGEQR